MSRNPQRVMVNNAADFPQVMGAGAAPTFRVTLALSESGKETDPMEEAWVLETETAIGIAMALLARAAIAKADARAFIGAEASFADQMSACELVQTYGAMRHAGEQILAARMQRAVSELVRRDEARASGGNNVISLVKPKLPDAG